MHFLEIMANGFIAVGVIAATVAIFGVAFFSFLIAFDAIRAKCRRSVS
jgi:hypothetical protein